MENGLCFNSDLDIDITKGLENREVEVRYCEKQELLTAALLSVVNNVITLSPPVSSGDIRGHSE
ncbi:hypothetical protein J6590_030579 [Homalodisca vitripennis]|nr:hypothetical protein J6590_030579 [Homalodisca vitripennis]